MGNAGTLKSDFLLQNALNLTGVAPLYFSTGPLARDVLMVASRMPQADPAIPRLEIAPLRS